MEKLLDSVRSTFLPFSKPVLEAEEEREILECVRSGWITTGPRTARFEEMYRQRLGMKHAVAVNSATAGWHITAHALGIGPGDEVIVPAITWASVPNIVELLGATTVFADVLPETLQIDPDHVRRLLSPRTKAVMPVHFAGAPCDLDTLRQILDGSEIVLIEDAAHAPGASYKGQEIGSDSDIAIFSFHPIKNITTGEGGMVVLNDDTLADRLRLLRFHGVTKDAWKRYSRKGLPQYEILEPGYKYNMLDLQAALGICQLPKLNRFNQARTKLAKRYHHLFKEIAEVTPLATVPYAHEHCWSLYVVSLETDMLGIDRNQFMAALGAAKIGSGLHFPALHSQPYYRQKYPESVATCPNAQKAGDRIMSLPLYPGLTESDQDDVCRALKNIIALNRS